MLEQAKSFDAYYLINRSNGRIMEQLRLASFCRKIINFTDYGLEKANIVHRLSDIMDAEGIH